MNFLAHFQLAAVGGDWERAGPIRDVEVPEGGLPDGSLRDGLMIGALLGDFVKGPLRGELPFDWEQGIRLHRRLDAHSDSLASRALLAGTLPPARRRYAGILLDLYFDFWLSNHWETCARQPLPAFSQHVYRLLARHHAELPPAAQHFSARLRDHDLLNRYRDWEVITGALARIGSRLRKPVPLADTSELMLANRELLDEACAAAWGELRLIADGFAQEISASPGRD